MSELEILIPIMCTNQALTKDLASPRVQIFA